MFIYRITEANEDLPMYHGTLDAAKDAGKKDGAQRIELLNVSTDKDGILNILNGKPSFSVERSWMTTRRGGWSEIEVGEPIPATQAAEVGDSAPPQPVVAKIVNSHAEKSSLAAARFEATGIDLQGDEPLPTDAKAEAEMEEYRAAHPHVPYDQRVKGKVK